MENKKCEHTIILEHDCKYCQEVSKYQMKYYGIPVITTLLLIMFALVLDKLRQFGYL